MTRTIANRLGAAARLIPAIALGGMLLADPVLASGFGNTNTEITTESCNLLFTIKDWLFNVVYILGAIGLVIIAVSAFLGRFKFSHLIALGGGLFIVAAADLLIGFITAGTGNTNC